MIDGTGLPPGEGTPAAGKIVWQTYCERCHGATGTEGPIMPPIGSTQVFPKSAGKFWPYATTLFDFIRRAMPFMTPKLLNNDEVYAVTAFILQRNSVIPENAVMNATTLPRVSMPKPRELYRPLGETGRNTLLSGAMTLHRQLTSISALQVLAQDKLVPKTACLETAAVAWNIVWPLLTFMLALRMSTLWGKADIPDPLAHVRQ